MRFATVASAMKAVSASLPPQGQAGYKNVLDKLRIALSNLESDLAVMLARHLDRPREVKKLLATLFAAPDTVRVSSRGVTVRLIPAATDSARRPPSLPARRDPPPPLARK